MSPKKLIEQVLPSDPGANNTYIRIIIDGELAGNVFATRWNYEGHPIVWITQLCVSSKFRNRGMAKKLLDALRQKGDCGFGILSSHPFAILAVLRVYGGGPDNVNLKMMKLHARKVMDSCPVGYVKEAKLRGTLFGGDDEDGSVSCADTRFWVDHEEPLEALRILRERGTVWQFGDLLDGHEFIVLVKGKGANQREGSWEF